METADEEKLLIQEQGSRYTTDGTVDINKQPALKQSTGNWRTCFFILGSEFSECLCFFAVAKNLVTYLTSVLHESNVDAARSVSTWVGTCFVTPLIGAFMSDAYWGRYSTIVVFLSVYAVGMLVLTISASLPLPLSSSDSGGILRVAVYLGLYLAALGTGGIKPCCSSLGADQFDSADRVERVAKGSFFNWYYFSINIGSLLSATLLVWVQDNIGWSVGFAIPMVVMVLGLAVFVTGRKVYRYKKQGGGSPLARVSQVVVAAVRNCHLKLPDDTSLLHELPSLTEESYKSSIHLNSGLKTTTFTVPPASLSTFDIISVLVWIPVYDAVLMPLARRVNGNERGFSHLQRIGIGYALSAVAMAYSAVVEATRLAAARSKEVSMSIMWQAPSYCVLGIAEVFATIGMLEFFYDQSPEAMKSLGAALAHLAIAGGNYLNTGILVVVMAATARGGTPGWIPDNLDEGHLDRFFWLMAFLSVLNLLQFIYCSMRYKG